MKFTEVRDSAAGHYHYFFALGKEEAAILLDLVSKSYRHTPKILRTLPTISRLRSMSKAIADAIPQFRNKNDGDDVLCDDCSNRRQK